MSEFEPETSRLSLTPARQARIGRWTLALSSIGVLVVASLVLLLESDPEPRVTDYDAHRAGRTGARRVLWVGHSLIDARDVHAERPRDVSEMVGEFAMSEQLTYDGTLHTLFGASLSVLWSGHALSYDRDEPEFLAAREALEPQLGEYDALVMTEGVPIERSLESERSTYFASQFYCAIVSRNPRARVYIYESWTHFRASDRTLGYSEQDNYNFALRQGESRPEWDRLADVAGTGRVPRGDTWDTLERAVGQGEPVGCDPKAPIFIIPVATAMAALTSHLAEVAPGWAYRDEQLVMDDLFVNPYVEWPEGWPREPGGEPDEVAAVVAQLPAVHPGEPIDDIHASHLGVYFAALVSYATLFRRSPIGLDGIEGLSEETTRGLQELVWREVISDARTGVVGRPSDAAQ